MVDIPIKITEINNISIKNNDSYIKKTTYNVNLEDKSHINTYIFNDIYNKFEKKYGATNVEIKVVSNKKKFTFKMFGDKLLNITTFQEYYGNKIYMSNFHLSYIYNLEISIKENI